MSKLALIAQPEAFFHELVTTSLTKNAVTTAPETEFYLVNLLKQFLKTESLYPRSSDGSVKAEPLALLWKEALEMPQPQVRSTLFRHIGDVSLYVAGYFQESLNRKLVDVDYYIEMGGSAYSHVALLETERVRPVFYELSDKFPSFVDVLAEVSDKTSPKTEKDILRLYELWVRTGSERAAKALQEAGIVPNTTLKKDKLQ